MEALATACRIEAGKRASGSSPEAGVVVIVLGRAGSERCSGPRLTLAGQDASDKPLIQLNGRDIPSAGLAEWEYHRFACQRALDSLDAAEPLAILPEPVVPPAPLSLATSLGGGWRLRSGPGAHRGNLEAEVRLGFAKQLAAAVLRASWQPTLSLDGDVPADVTTAAVVAGLGPSFGFGALRLTPLVSLEALWERVIIAPPTRLDTLQSAGWSLFVRLELELEWRPISGLRLALAAAGRGAAQDRAVSWLGQTASSNSPLSLDLTLRVGWYWL